MTSNYDINHVLDVFDMVCTDFIDDKDWYVCTPKSTVILAVYLPRRYYLAVPVTVSLSDFNGIVVEGNDGIDIIDNRNVEKRFVGDVEHDAEVVEDAIKNMFL